MSKRFNDPVVHGGVYHKFLRFDGYHASGRMIVSDITGFSQSVYWSEHWQDSTHKRYLRKCETIVKGREFQYHVVDAPHEQAAHEIATMFHTGRYQLHLNTLY